MSKKRIANYVFLPGVSSDSNAFPNAYSLIQANKTFIQKEANAYISAQIIADTAQNVYPNAVSLLTRNKQFILDEISAWTTAQVAAAQVGNVFYGYTYGATEISKCKRDMGYLIDALIYDIRYGGNERVKYVASQYYLSGVVQLINVPVELAIQTKLWNLIIGFVMLKISYSPSAQSPVTSTQSLTGTAAEANAVTRATSLSTIASNVMAGGLSTLPATIYSIYNFAGYTYDLLKCERDIGYVIDAYLNDLRYGGNAKIRLIASRYWDGEVPQVDGDRKPEIVTHAFIRNLINHTILFGAANTAKCERDIGYLLDGVEYDVALGTNYNQVFLGLAEYNSQDLTDNVIATIQNASVAVQGLSAVAADSTAASRVSGFFGEVLDIAQNGRINANTLSFTNPTSATSSQIAAKDKLIANRDFLAAEVNAWVALNHPEATHDTAKCTRDLHYAIDAICYDVLYGGNSATYAQAKFFFYSFADGSAGINPAHTVVTVAAYTYLKSIIDNIVTGQTITPTTTGANPNVLTQVLAGNNALVSEGSVCQALVQITAGVINAGTQAAALAYLAGIAKTYPDVSWATTPLQNAKTAIATNKAAIIASVADYVPLQDSYPRQTLSGIAGEDGSDARITALESILATVIQNGLTSVPLLVNGVTTIKLQGKFELDKLLLITNATNNQFIYNFSDPALGAIATFDAPHNSNGNDKDADYPRYLQTVDYITTLTLRADTSLCSSTDDVQIFVEAEEQKVRPYDFGTDAIERMRVAQPQSMLDADFEYGLQPTKWQAIGVARGYPSIYEIPGTDTAVVSVVTDASSGTSGIGESLITVTTQGAHGFSVGTPITIRSLANTISGFSRAEGTFIIISVPTTTSFTYYATAKVGTSNGQVLATTYTQLRKGNFYTGASIGQPTLSVYSNGVVSNFTTKFATSANTDQIAVAGSLPPLNSPISGTGINSGTQVSGTVGPGGLAVTTSVSAPANPGDTVISVASSTGILEGMAINNGTGTAVFVSSVSGNTISLTQPLTAFKAGSFQTYLNVTGTNVTPGGSGATFNIDRNAGQYANVQVATGSSGYTSNTRILIAGTSLGGSSPANDAVIKVTTIDQDQFNGVAQFSSTGTGTNSSFDVSISNSNTYSAVIANPGSGFAATDTVLIKGSSLGGLDITNDLTITVTAVTQSYTNVAQSSITPTGGTGARFTVSRTGTAYSVDAITVEGSGYTIGDVITITGSNLGGVDTVNDLTFTVTFDNASAISTVGNITGVAAGTGQIATFTTSGVGNPVYGIVTGATLVSGQSVSGERSYDGLSQSTTTLSGIGATFNVVTSGGVYDVTLVDSGSTYTFGEQIVIFGSLLDGIDGTNDLIIDVTSVSGAGGGIISFNTSGTPATTNTTFSGVSGVNTAPGSGASFDVTRSGGSYTAITVNLPGAGYAVNDVIKITGSNFNGADTTNDLTIVVTAAGLVSGPINNVNGSGTAVTGSSVDFYSAVALSDVTNASIPDATSISTAAIATIQISFNSAHGLVPGASLLVDITSAGTNHAFAKGPFYVESVPTPTTLRYTARTSGTIDTGVSLVGIVYSRPDSYFIHRPFDGGVQLGTGGPQHGVQAIRMSKKYIRYQSGKGIMYTTGALFAPSYNLQAISADGTSVGSYITVTTDDVDHGCQVGGRVKILGVDTAGYNGTYTIVDVITERIFKVQAQTTLANLYGMITTAAQMSILNWHGATVRAGTFDDQNGMYWQYDGKELAVGRRSSTLQLSGVSSIVKDTNIMTGTNTRFRDQVKAGDRIVIKGMTHVVSNVTSQTSMTVTPDYRGAINAVQAKVCLVQDVIVKQSEFNLDRLDGTGPSGYNLDITKMQMIGMQWSWYGAGFIDFMLRGSDGNYVFAHRIRNSNVNTEAYMRTGNMPVRYEVINEGAIGKLVSSITSTQTTIPLTDASTFPNESGIVYIDNELIAFSGKSGNSLIGCTRAAPMVNFVGGAQRTFRGGDATTHEVNTGVILISNTISPIISHWGSAFLTDGRFDDDRGYLFNYASTGIQASTTKQTAFLIRLAPSVSNAIIGDLGERELINRAQLLLKAIEVTSDTGTGGLVVEGVLNPQNYPIDPSAITWSGLAGSSAGGQPSFAQVAPGGSVSWSGGASVTTSTATTTSALTGNATVPNNALFTTALGSNTIYVTKASWDSLGAASGFSVASTETKFPSGTTISTITANPAAIATTLGLVTGSAQIPPIAAFKTPTGVNYLYITQASWTALNGAVGQGVSSNDFPAGTTVTNVAGPATANGASYYTVTFSQNATVPHNPVKSTLTTYYVQVNANVAYIYFSITQTYAPYSIGDSITITGNTGSTFVNGTWNVSACTTTYVAFNLVAANYGVAVGGSVTNNNVLASATLFVTGQATSGTNSLNFTQASWAGLPIGTPVVGNTTDDTGKFALGTTISTISTLKTFNGVNYYTVTFSTNLTVSLATGVGVTFAYTPYYAITLSKNSTSSVAANSTVAFTPAIIGTNTSFLYFTQASWETLVTSYGATSGTEVVDVLKFPSGTKVQSISTLSTFGGTAYYRVNFTQSSIASIANGSTITFQFGLPPYAQPGETVFSFIAAPGTTAALDLSDLKELTNTTLGGRGTYPNGPDVLAINVYRASGTGSIPTNVIVRWGEAQA